MKSIKIYIRKLIRGWFFSITNIKWSDKLITRTKVDYILSLNEIFREIETVPGNIIELGAGRGRNAVIFGSLIKRNQQEKFKKYFGFDTFDSFTDSDIKISPHLKKQNISYLDTYENVKDFIASNNLDEVCKLVKGDILESLPKFIENKNNKYLFNKLYISLLYIDCNSFRAAEFALENLKNYFSKGCLILCDENVLGDETNALKKFCEKNNLEIKSTKYKNHISSYTIWNK